MQSFVTPAPFPAQAHAQRGHLIPLRGVGQFPDLIESYLLSCRAKGMSERTLSWYQQKLGTFVAWLESRMLSLDVNDLDKHTLRSFIATIQGADRSPFTVRGYTQVIKGFYSWLDDEDYLKQGNPIAKVELPKLPKYKVQPIPEEDLSRLFNTINTRRRNGARDLTILLLLFDSGMRLGEVARLSLDDAMEAIQQGVVKVFGKGKRERFVPVGTAAQNALRRYLHQKRKDRPGQLFLAESGGALTPEGIREMIQRRAHRAGLEGIHPHRLRHSFAVSFLRGGGGAFELQKLLGHSTLEMTRNYVQLLYDDVKEAHRRASPADRLYRPRK